MPFHYTTNPTKIPKTNSYSLAHSQIKGSRKKKKEERERERERERTVTFNFN